MEIIRACCNLYGEETEKKRGRGRGSSVLLDRPIVCRIFYSIRVAAFLPPRTFLRRRQYSFEALQPAGSIYNILGVYVCIPREKKDWKFNLKRTEFFVRFHFPIRIFDENDRNDRERERERAHKRDRSVSILDHRYVETTRGKRWRRYPGDVAAAFQMLYPRVIDHAPLYIYLSLYGCTSFE